jgi:hypothetical protein
MNQEGGLIKLTKLSYLEVYTDKIVPRLQAIDLCLKSGEGIDHATAADLLDITDNEATLLREGKDGKLSTDEFLLLMQFGSSELCGMFRRELERRSPVIYTVDDIAYIYGLDRDCVQLAFDKLNASAVTEYLLPEVFSEIWI